MWYRLSVTAPSSLDVAADERDFGCLPQLRELMQKNITVALSSL